MSIIELMIGILSAVGIMLVGINIVIKGFRITHALSLLAMIGGFYIIMHKNDIAATLFPFFKKEPMLLIIFPLVLLVLTLSTFSKRYTR